MAINHQLRENVERASRYVRAIKNGPKRTYAMAYLNRAAKIAQGFYSPSTPEPEATGLSTMGAQAVRMNIAMYLSEGMSESDLPGSPSAPRRERRVA